MEERRRFPRAAYPCKIVIAVEKDRDEFNLHTENISSGGARVILPKSFQVNMPATIEIAIGERTIRTKGRVVWVLKVKAPAKTTTSHLFDTGIEFAQLNPDDREFLSGLVADLLAQNRES